MKAVEERVETLEELMADLIKTQKKTELEIQELKREMLKFKDEIREDTQRLKEEMLKFKDEIREDTQRLKEEMLKFKDEIREDTKELKEEMIEFKNEMGRFKDEMGEFKDWAKASIENLNKEIGRIANKMGKLVEDIVEPAFHEIVKKYFNCDSYDIASNIKRRSRKDKSKIIEIDVLVECDDLVIVNETKSNPTHVHVEKFAEFAKSEKLFEYFPEFRGKKVVYVFSSLNIPESEINYLTKNGIYAMHMSGPYMEIVNFDEVNESK